MNATTENRPARRIQQEFAVAELESGLISGDYRYGVMAGIAIVQSGLTAKEAEVLVVTLTKKLDGFREWRGLGPAPQRQLEFAAA